MSHQPPSTLLLQSLRGGPLVRQCRFLSARSESASVALSRPLKSPTASRVQQLPKRSASSVAADQVQPQRQTSYPQQLLERRSAYDRDLPPLSALRPQYKWLKTMPIFLAIITLSALALFNYQKVNSPIITANLYSLRTNPTVRSILGNEVYFASKWAWIFGQINLVQGRVDVEFEVGGTRKKGWCRFVARRHGGRNGGWRTEIWSLKMADEEVDLLKEVDGDPMEGASY